MEFFGGKKWNFFEEKMRLFRLKLDVWVKKWFFGKKRIFGEEFWVFVEKWLKNGDFWGKKPKFGFFWGVLEVFSKWPQGGATGGEFGGEIGEFGSEKLKFWGKIRGFDPKLGFFRLKNEDFWPEIGDFLGEEEWGFLGWNLGFFWGEKWGFWQLENEGFFRVENEDFWVKKLGFFGL